MEKGKVISTVVLIFLACFVLFGVTDPVDVYDGLINVIRKLSEKGDWVKNLWVSIAQGDIKLICGLIKDFFFDNGIVGFIGGLLK